MKKLTFGIFSVLMMLGGIFLSACGNKNVSMSVSTNEVVIFTNYENAETYQSKQIQVNLSNSSSGVRAEVVSGQGRIRTSKVTQRKDGVYVFTIFGDIAGEGQVKVSSVEKSSISETINVQVKTRIDSIVQSESSSERSSLFVVKGEEKDLATGSLYDFKPETANVTDVNWNFIDPDGDETNYIVEDNENGQSLFYKSSDWLLDSDRIEIARLVGSKIFVVNDKASNGDMDDDYYERLSQVVYPNSVKVRVSAEFKSDIYVDLDLKILEKASIQSFVLNNDNIVYQNSKFVSDQSFSLKRNNVTGSNLKGELKIASANNKLKITPQIYLVQSGRASLVSNYEKYFNFQPSDTNPQPDSNGVITYEFNLDVLDRDFDYTVGDFLVYFNISYVDYEYDVSTGKIDNPIVQIDETESKLLSENNDENADIFVRTRYMVSETRLYGSDNKLLNDETIDVFSNYVSADASTLGLEVRTQLEPSKVALDRDYFYIQITDGDRANFVLRYQDRIVNFDATGKSERTFKNGDIVYITASQNLTSQKKVSLDFISNSNPDADASINLNLYKITANENLRIKRSPNSQNLEDIEERYISSNSLNSLEYLVRVYGVVSKSGLSIVSNNNNLIKFSDIQEVGQGTEEVEQGVFEDYIDVRFMATLLSTNFDDTTVEFYLSHVTGKKSETLKIVTFRPLENVSITVSENQSSGVYLNRSSVQDFVEVGGTLRHDSSYSSNSASKIMVEAGTILSLSTVYQTLENGVRYRFLNFDDLKEDLKHELGDGGEAEANRIFDQADFEAILNYNRDATNVPATYFSITDNRLSVYDTQFKGFVFAYFTGYQNSKDDLITIVRIFAIESFYAVSRVNPNVREKRLFTSETLSPDDMNLSVLNVSVSFRTDDKAPTYLEETRFEFVSQIQALQKTNIGFENDYYSVSNIRVSQRYLLFTITANSTQWQTVVYDTLNIVYNGPFDFNRTADIDLEIRNVQRVESVKWINKTQDEEIYLNLTAPQNSKERSFTILTNVMPWNANNLQLTHYVIGNGSFVDMHIDSTTDGQTISLQIGNNIISGGVGYLYLLPNDMVKANGVLVYSYVTDEDGNLILDADSHPQETAHYIPLRDIHSYYDQIINGGTVSVNGENYEVSNFMLNNDGKKIYNKDLIVRIKVVLADGNSSETAIRVYDESALKTLDISKHYRIMNNLTVSGWKAYDSFSGEIFGNQPTITINFENGSQNFVNVLEKNSDNHEGEIHDLTFTGDVASLGNYSGYVANINRGKIYNVSIDIYNDGSKYASSKLTSTQGEIVGGIVGANFGTIENSRAYGMSIDAGSANNVGGLVGRNEGTISGCGFEFYTFDVDKYNKITTAGTFGGLAGFVTEQSVIEKSYVYAYPLEDSRVSINSLIDEHSNSYLFVGNAETGASVRESFAFLGDNKNPNQNDQSVSYSQSYFVNVAPSSTTIYFLGTGTKLDNKSFNLTKIGDADYIEGIAALNKDIWETEQVGNENFGFVYLKNARKNESVNINSLSLRENERFLKVNNDNGILYLFKPDANITDVTELSALERLNTLSLNELFDISESASRMLILLSDCKDVKISTNSVTSQKVSSKMFSISARSKSNLTESRDFNFIVLNNLPEFSTSVNGVVFEDDETVMLQKGDESTLNVVYTLNTNIYLNGTGYPSELTSDNYTIEFDTIVEDKDTNLNELNEKYVDIQKDGTLMKLTGKNSHKGNDSTYIESSLNIVGFDKISGLQDKTENVDDSEETYLDIYKKAILKERQRNFNVRVFDGATDLVVNARILNFTPSGNASFDARLYTDNLEDNLVFTIKYGERSWTTELDKDVYNGSFVLSANKFALNISWTKQVKEDNIIDFKVSIKIPNEYKHLLDEKVSFEVEINALSKVNDESFAKKFDCNVNLEEIADIRFKTYAILDRQVTNNILYLRTSSNIINTIVPASDAIAVVSVRPEYTYMTHFDLTYSIVGETTGTVVISKLQRHQIYGYYTSQENVSYLSNGIRVELTDEDRTLGNGDFYFRIYASSNLKTKDPDGKIEIKFNVSYYNQDTLLRNVSEKLDVSYLRDPTVMVEGTNSYMMAKGSNAKFTVTVRRNQTAEIYLANQGRNISLILDNPEGEIVGQNRVYTGTVVARLNSTVYVANQEFDNGEFYVCANVEQMVNGEVEHKVSTAKVYLVDFTIDEQNPVTILSSGNKIDNYDVLYAYKGSSEMLSFNYSILPQVYDNYDHNNSDEVEAYAKIMREKNEFYLNNYYSNSRVGYYINYNYSMQTGFYSPMTLKEQLYLVTNGVATPIYRNGSIRDSAYFSIDEDPSTHQITITGTNLGRQIMRLETVIRFGDLVRRINYDFMILVDTWTDEETPTPIYSEDDFKAIKNAGAPDDYILMNDIVLHEYTPFENTENISSLDGNGYTIHIDNFVYPTDTVLELALFNTVSTDTTLKNIIVNVYRAGQIVANVAAGSYSQISIAGFAINNDGIIYNCHVVSYYSDLLSSRINGDEGISVRYTNGEGNDENLELTERNEIDSTVVGFVVNNNSTGSITNCRVGGTEFKHIQNIAGINYVATDSLNVFTIDGQGDVAGFVGTNNGYISASFASNIQINNRMNSNSSHTAGFVLENNSSGHIQTSYIEGQKYKSEGDVKSVVSDGTNITSRGYIAGFVYNNSGLVKNCYANIGINNSSSLPYYVAGFVYENQENATVTLSLAVCVIASSDINQLPFSGIRDEESLNFGEISLCYFYSSLNTDSTNEKYMNTNVVPISHLNLSDEAQNSLFGFSFSSKENEYDGIWEVTDNGVSLVSANQIAFSNRYSVVGTNGEEQFFYNTTIRDSKTLLPINLSYGSRNNPIIIRSAFEFARVTGRATSTEISSYKEYYNDESVFGNYRFVRNIVFDDDSNVDQNPTGQQLNDKRATLTTSTKTFRGLIDGNGFTISDINLSNENTSTQTNSQRKDFYGLFAKMEKAVVMNLDLVVTRISASSAHVVGTLAGVAINSRLISITLSSTSDENMYVIGYHIVGGVVGMLLGDSKMQGIDISDIEIYSSDHTENKSIYHNAQYTGQNIRNIVARNGNIIDAVENGLSYAGAIVGYVDIFSDDSFVRYDQELTLSDYDIITAHVSGSVNIYGEIVGGLFGYVGSSTYIYDATLILDANQNLNTPSYIISKNLYAGGIVGENYGGLFAVQATYNETLRTEIEENMHNYYNGFADERGQQSIFSFTENDKDKVDIERFDDPLFVGGIAGFMGGGYIYIGYSKLNVISHSPKTKAVGGIVGFATGSANLYPLNFVKRPTPYVNIFLGDVYSSGDVYADGKDSRGKYVAVSGGIIGSMGCEIYESVQYTMPVIAMKNCLAMNYYSYQSNALLGDNNANPSSNHSILIGNAIEFRGDSFAIVGLSTNLYLIGADNTQYNVYTNSDLYLRPTVGGYQHLSIGVDLDAFGFNWAFGKNTDQFININNAILCAEHIGESVLSNVGTAHVYYDKYFLQNGWNDEFWVHDNNDLFPHIELMKKDLFLVWDWWNTYTVLETIKENNGEASLTLVLRGQETKENDSNFVDIDLTGGKDIVDPNGGGSLEKTEVTELLASLTFKGRIISYEQYLNLDNKHSPQISSGTSYGGNKGDERNKGDAPGIILNQPLFESLQPNSSIEGINFYFLPEGNTTLDGSLGSSSTTYSLIKNNLDRATFKDNRLTYNTAVTITARDEKIDESDNTHQFAGLVAPRASSSSFINTKIVSRNTSGLADIAINAIAENEGKIAHLGLLTGQIVQDKSFNSIVVSGIEVTNPKRYDPYLDLRQISFNFGKSEIGYAGMYVGDIVKKENGSKITVGMSQLNELAIDLSGSADNPDIYFGGLVGNLNGVDEVNYEGQKEETQRLGPQIYQNMDVENFYAGLAFGNIEGSGELNLIGYKNGRNYSVLKGAIYQGFTKGKGNYSTNKAYIGGIAGQTSSNINIQDLYVDFTLSRVTNVTQENGKTKIETPSYNKRFDAPNTEEGWERTDYNANYISVGGVIGKAIGNRISATQDLYMTGVIDVAACVVNAGGFIGESNSTIITNVNSFSQSDINFAIYSKTPTSSETPNPEATGEAPHYASAGGLIGSWTRADTSGMISELKLNSDTTDYFEYIGTMLFKADNVYAGGMVGTINDGNNKSSANTFGHLAYGGMINIQESSLDSKYGDKNSNSEPINVYVGGIVGQQTYKGDGSQQDIYDNCLSFGDVFTLIDIYDYIYTDGRDVALQTYVFGGIVGDVAKAKITNCKTLMTDYNNLIATGSDGDTGYYSNAIYGKTTKENGVAFDKENPNYYASGVTLTYQSDGKVGENIDCYYGSHGTTDEKYNYSGYTNATSLNTDDSESSDFGDGNLITSDHDILDDFRDANIYSLENTLNRGNGYKLNPIKFEADSLILAKSPTNTEGTEEIEEPDQNLYNYIILDSLTNYHGKTWIYLSEDIERTQNLGSEFSNAAFVGNGHTITIKDNSTTRSIANGDDTSYGGLFDKMTNSILSNVIVDLDIETLEYKVSTENYNAISYGGAVGSLSNHSIVYGVGVKGNLSVGANVAMHLSGLVGQTYTQTLINECYVDCDITYRAGTSINIGAGDRNDWSTRFNQDNGSLSGLTNFVAKRFMNELIAGEKDPTEVRINNYSATIKNSYTAGLLKTYTDVNVYTFFNATYSYEAPGFAFGDQLKDYNTYRGESFVQISDVYSTSQVQRENIEGVGEGSSSSTATSSTYFYKAILDGNDLFKLVGNQALTGSDCFRGQSTTNILKSLNFNEDKKSEGINQFITTDGNQHDTMTKWYYSPYVNYGFPSHGFGFLKNATTYYKEEIKNDENKTTSKEFKDVEYEDILKYGSDSMFGANVSGDKNPHPDWYLGINSLQKFEQMIDVMSKSADKNYKFRLRYDLDMKNFDSTKYGQTMNVVNGGKFVLDGDGKTLDFSFTESKNLTNPLFGTVTGDIENLRLTNINVNGGAATLATTLTGNITNLSVTGNLTTSASIAGGVVGTLTGSADRINSIVNVTNKVTKSSVIVTTGGIIGTLAESDTSGTSTTYSITNSSNSGQIKAIGYTKAYTGGIVAYVNTNTKVENCYNTSAVLSSFEEYEMNYNCESYVGGIVGVYENLKSENKDIGIYNCYNTGLIGAGDYSRNGDSFGIKCAGGIVGSAYSGIEINGCINDGAVQAIGPKDAGYTYEELNDKNTKFYEVKVEKIETEGNNLSYEVTLTYNPETSRTVYAYGIGRVSSSASITDCASSTENIKNDGNIGSISITETLTFDKSEISSNFGSGYSIKFLDDTTDPTELLKISGKDSYGFPSRYYMPKTIEVKNVNGDPLIRAPQEYRNTSGDAWDNEYFGIFDWDGSSWKAATRETKTYSGGTFDFKEQYVRSTDIYENYTINIFDDAFDNSSYMGFSQYEKTDFKKRYQELNSSNQKTMDAFRLYEEDYFFNNDPTDNENINGWITDGVTDVTYRDNIPDKNNARFSIDTFDVKSKINEASNLSSLNCYSSVEFPGYEEVLEGYTGGGKYDETFLLSNASSKQSSYKKLDDISAEIESQIAAIEKAIDSSDGLKNILINGNHYSQVKSKDGYLSAISTKKYTGSFTISPEQGETISKITITDDAGNILNYDLTKSPEDDNSYIFTLYCKGEVRPEDVQINVTYVKTITAQLNKGTLIDNNGRHFIVLSKADDESLLSKEVVEGLNSGLYKVDNFRVGNNIPTGYTFGFDETGETLGAFYQNMAYAELSYSPAMYDGYQLTFDILRKQISEQEMKDFMLNEASDVSIDLTSYKEKVKDISGINFYQQTTIGELGSFISEVSDEENSQIEIDLSTLPNRLNSSKIALGDFNYQFTYQNNIWRLSTSSEIGDDGKFVITDPTEIEYLKANFNNFEIYYQTDATLSIAQENIDGLLFKATLQAETGLNYNETGSILKISVNEEEASASNKLTQETFFGLTFYKLNGSLSYSETEISPTVAGLNLTIKYSDKEYHWLTMKNNNYSLKLSPAELSDLKITGTKMEAVTISNLPSNELILRYYWDYGTYLADVEVKKVNQSDIFDENGEYLTDYLQWKNVFKKSNEDFFEKAFSTDCIVTSVSLDMENNIAAMWKPSYNSIYEVYKSGAIVLTLDINDTKEEESKYIYFDGKIYQIDKSEYTISGVNEELWDFNNFKDITSTTTFEKIFATKIRLTWQEDSLYYEQYAADFIDQFTPIVVLDFDENGITFGYDGTDKVDSTRFKVSPGQNIYSAETSISVAKDYVWKNYKTGLEIDLQKENSYTVSGDKVYYKSSNDVYWTTLEDGQNTISGNSFDEIDYTIKEYKSRSTSVSGLEDKSDTLIESKDNKAIILGGDFYLGNYTLKVDKPIFGNNHIIKLLGDKEILIARSKIYDLNIVGAISLEDLINNMNLIQINSTAELKNVKLFGNARNLYGADLNVIKDSTANKKNIELTSYLAVTSISQSKNSEIYEQNDFTNYNSFDIIISADGLNGRISDGRTSANGSDGGNITITKSNQIIRLGIGGKGSYGKDEAIRQINNLPGNDGQAGELTFTSKDQALTPLVVRTIDKTNYIGNSGYSVGGESKRVDYTNGIAYHTESSKITFEGERDCLITVYDDACPLGQGILADSTSRDYPYPTMYPVAWRSWQSSGFGKLFNVKSGWVCRINNCIENNLGNTSRAKKLYVSIREWRSTYNSKTFQYDIVIWTDKSMGTSFTAGGLYTPTP